MKQARAIEARAKDLLSADIAAHQEKLTADEFDDYLGSLSPDGFAAKAAEELGHDLTSLLAPAKGPNRAASAALAAAGADDEALIVAVSEKR